MMKCKDVARLMTSDLVSSSSPMKKMEVRLHLMMCEHCSRLLKQLKELRAAASRIARHIDQELDRGTGSQLENRILHRLSRDGQRPPQSQ